MTLDDVTAFSFDCYGTLIDWESGLSSVLDPWAARHGLSMSGEELLTRYAAHETAAESAAPTALYPQVLATGLEALGAELGIQVTEQDAQTLGSSVPEWPAFDDSAEALSRLGRRFSLLILSNVDRASFAASNRLLGVRFTSVITAQDVGSYKPAQRNFDALLEEAKRLGIPESALVHVAQSLFHDHVPAQRAGLRTVWINRRYDRPGWGATPPPATDVVPDWEFSSMVAFADAVLGPTGRQNPSRS
jgi:2-haloacid dehalogenase